MPVLAMLFAVGTFPFFPKSFVASATIQVRGSGAGIDPAADLEKNFAILQSAEVLDPVIESLGLKQKWGETEQTKVYTRLRKSLRIQDIRTTELIQISVLNTDPKQAAQVANAVAGEFQRLKTAGKNGGQSVVTIWERAEAPATPALPNIYLNLLVSAFFGLILGAVLAVIVK